MPREDGDRPSARPLAGLLSGIAHDSTALLRGHVSLVRAELAASLVITRDAAKLLGSAAACIFVALIFLLLAVAELVNTWANSEWIGFLVASLLPLPLSAALYLMHRSRLEKWVEASTLAEIIAPKERKS